MNLVSIGHNYCHNRSFQIDRPNGIDEYLLLIIRSKAVFRFGDQDVKVNPNSLILFNKGTPQHFRAVDDLYVNDWITFTLSPEKERLFINENIPFDVIFESNEVDACSEIIKLIQKEWCSVNTSKDDVLGLYFKILYIKLKGIFNQSDKIKPYYNQLLMVRTRIYNDPSAEYRIKDLAGDLNLSNSYFQHLYKNYFGISTISDVINSRIEFSKQLLSSTNYTIKEVSEILGYENDTQFMRQFKLKTGMTATEYKKTFSV